MPTVPTYNRQVQPDTPNIPSVNLPQAPRAAFGEDVVQANKGIGNVVSGIGKLLQQRQKEKYELEQDQLETNTYHQYEMAKQDLLFSTETEDININGQDIQRPKGILNRKLGQAQGSTDEFYIKANKYAMESIRNIKDPNTRAKLAARFSQDVYSTREKVIRHESTEYINDKVNTFKSGIETALENAFRVTNENELDIQLENALINQDSLNKTLGVDKATAQSNLNDTMYKTIGNAVLGSLEYDKTGGVAKGIISYVKPKIRKEEEIKLNDLVDKGLKKISKEKTEELANKFLNDELTIEEVMLNSRPQEEGGIGAKQAEQMIKKIKKHQTAEMANIYENITDSQKYIDVINSTLLDDTDAEKFKRILIDAYSDGTLNKKEKDQLIKLKSLLTEKRSRDNHPIMTNIGIIKNFYGVNNRDPRSLAVSIHNFLDDVEQSKNPEESRDSILRNEYNALYPENPLSEEDQVIDPQRESEIFWKPAIDQIRRKAKGFGTGVGSTVEGLGQGLISAGKTKNIGFLSPMLLIKVDGKTISEHLGKAISDQGELMKNFYYVDDPDFTDMLAQGFGSTATFLIPGIGIARGVNAATAFPRIAAWLGVTASSVLEATVEGGSVYKSALESGLPEVNAADLASSVFWTNLPLLEVSNRLGIFGDVGPKVTQVIVSSLMEGAQEFTQSMITNIALNDPILQGAGQSFAIGAIVGGGSKLSVQATGALQELGDTADLMERIKAVRKPGEVLRSERGSTVNPLPEGNQEGEIIRDEQGNPIEINPQESNDATTPEVQEQGKTSEAEPISPEGEEGLDIGTQESEADLLKSFNQEYESIKKNLDKNLKGKIKRSEKGGEEESLIKKEYFAKEGGSTLDEIATENSDDLMALGYEVSEQGVKDYIQDQTGLAEETRIAKQKERISQASNRDDLRKFVKRIDKLMQGKQKTSAKTQINREAGVTRQEDKVYTERKALRQSLKRQASAALQASRETTKELTTVKKSIASIIKASLPIKERGRYLTMIANAKKGIDVAKSVMRIDRDVDTFNKKETIKDIKKMFKEAATSKNIAIDYVEKIKDLVSDVDFVNRRESTIEAIKQTQEYINNQKSLGNNVDLPQRILNKLSILTKRPIDQVNQEDLDNLRQDIANLIEVGKLKLKTRKEIDALRKENDLKALSTSTKAINSEIPGKTLPGDNKKVFDNLKDQYRNARDSAIKHGLNISPVDVNFDILDGNQEYTGENYRIFKKTIDSDFGEYLDLKDETQNEIKQLAHDLKLGNKDFELIGIHAAREQDGGFDKLLYTGYTEDQINSVKLNENQQTLYNAMRRKLDELRPKIEDIMKRVYNQPLAKVRNYFSFMTDFESMSDQEVREMFGNDVHEFGQKNRKNVEKGFTISRTLGKQKIKVNAMDIFLRHTENAAYLVALGEDIKYLGELAGTEEYGKMAGNVGQKMVLDWIDLLARKGSSGENRIKIIDNLRNNVGAATLGLKLSSALIQPTALMDGAGLIGKNAFTGFSDVVSQKPVREFVLNNFPEIKHRIGDDRAFSDYDDFDGLSKIRKIGYTPLKIMDGLTAAGVGFGAYKQYLEENNLPLDLENPNAEGVSYAQLIVRRTQSSPFFKDTAAIFNRGDAGLTGNLSVNRAILQFQSFMFNRWSLIRHDLIRLGIQEGNTKKALNIAFFLMLANFAETGFRHISKELVDLIATGHFDMEQYDETRGKDFAINAIQTIPYLGQAMSILEYSSNPIPTVAAIQTAIDAQDALKKSKKRSTIEKNRLRVLATIGTLAGVPGSAQADQVIKMKAEKRKMKMPKQ